MPIKQYVSRAPAESGAQSRLRKLGVTTAAPASDKVDEDVAEGISDVLEHDASIVGSNEDALQQFLKLFFQLNPEPSDEQVHGLAVAINITPEALEEVVYKAVGESTQEQ